MPDNDNTRQESTETPKLEDAFNVSSPISQPKKNKEPVKPMSKTLPSYNSKPAVSENVQKLNKLLEAFKTAYDSNEEYIGPLINICNYLNRTNDPKVFTAFTGWFAQNLDGCMNCEVALRGIHTIQNKRTKTRVGATHQCFEELVRVLKSRPRSHYRFTLKAMQAMEISENLGKWILRRTAE
ncbi:MAG: hypothetical protein J5614_09355 [Paludibacteraceae bacterium]|nr:hypothetical protein [Paludibacteraceae bacterium]